MASQPHSKARILPALKHIQLTDPLRRDYSPVATFNRLPYSVTLIVSNRLCCDTLGRNFPYSQAGGYLLSNGLALARYNSWPDDRPTLEIFVSKI
jgi:hypothetical protein